MNTILRVRGEVTEDGRLVVELPAGSPRGRVVVTLDPEEENEVELTEDDLHGLGLTAEEIADAPEIGSWAEGSNGLTGAGYVERVRSAPARYSW